MLKSWCGGGDRWKNINPVMDNDPVVTWMTGKQNKNIPSQLYYMATNCWENIGPDPGPKITVHVRPYLSHNIYSRRSCPWFSGTAWKCRSGQRWPARSPSQHCPSTRGTCWTFHWRLIIWKENNDLITTSHRKILSRKEDFLARKTSLQTKYC